ncbi:MAG: prolyl oligopeptidase family serine peptidase [bacterium]|nr:prolyl oligopeptidase family serine peptidase [bacterium]
MTCASLCTSTELVAQSAKRAVTHDDYDSWQSMRSTTYSRDGNWMSFSMKPRIGDGVMHVRQVDGDKKWQFDRGQRVTFANDNKHAFFKVGKSYSEERRRKLEKLYKKKNEEKESGAEEEEGEGLPPDVKAALAERGMTEAMAKRMMEQRGATIAEVRGFLGLSAPEKKGGAKKGGRSKASSADKEAEKANKALAKRLHILDLSTGEVTKIENVKSHRQPKDSDLLVLHFDKPEEKKSDKKKSDDKKAPEKEGAEKKGPEQKGAEKKSAEKKGTEKKAAAKSKKKEKKDPKEAKRSDGSKLVLRDLGNDAKDITIENVRSFGFLADDKWMWYTVGTKKMKEGVTHGLFARELATGRTVAVLAGYSNVSGMTTDYDRTRVAFSSDLATFGKKETERDLYVWDFSAQPAVKLVTKATAGIPEGYKVSSSGLGFSRDGSVLTFGVRPPKKEDLPKILSEDEIKLDLWHWRDGMLQTMQAKRSDPAQATLTTVFHQDSNRAVVLGKTGTPRVSMITDDGSRALVSDSKPYEQLVTWDGRYSDYYIVNTIDGSRRKIVDSLRGSARSSTGGNYVVWFDHRDYDWHAYDLRTSTARNLTKDLGVAFDREQDDRPEPHRAHGVAGWTKNDAEVLLYDEFDIWAVNPKNGAFRCITDGLGRATNTTFRIASVDLRPDAERDDNERRRWVEGDLVLSASNRDTYATGYWTDSLDHVGRPRKLAMRDCAMGRPTRPKDADRLFFTMSRWDQYPDVWTTDLNFGNAKKLTNGCPQLADLRWGKAELVSWRSDDDVDLKGYLVKPDGFDPKKKYPMMVYFYEKSSSRIHSFVTPNCGTSPNAAYYVSNGYLWFVPDIVYRDGYPGESCEKCVVSGVQHVVSMGFVDRDAIGVAGHSWGGYQTAHLITRTDIFAAAESGAPVVNMFSAYGGIRWSSGMSRQFQYEKTQSRIGGTIWERPMQYWENSPLFHLDKANTPVLILHNDRDGAVPWYQGIEFFVAMRRLQKEAYLFNYNTEDHGLRKRQNQRDWTRRMQEFFDHHLKGAPAPEWMKRGVPYHDRMAEKIPHAPSYREALEAGLIQKEEAAPAAVEASAEAGEAQPAGSGSR